MKVQNKVILDNTEVKSILSDALIARGIPCSTSAIFSVDSSTGFVTVETDTDSSLPASTPKASPPGTAYPPNTVVVGEATMFGLNWDGSRDKGDNGEGAWGAHTANKEIIGVSLPEGVLISTLGFSGTWKDNAVKVGKYLGDNKVQVDVSRDGKSILADIVDAGPAGYTHNAIDLTYALAHSLSTNGKAIVSYSIIKDNVPMEIKGWDLKNGVEIAQPGVA